MHCGVFVDNARVLHIEEGEGGSMIERLAREGFAWRAIQAYRLT